MLTIIRVNYIFIQLAPVVNRFALVIEITDFTFVYTIKLTVRLSVQNFIFITELNYRQVLLNLQQYFNLLYN